jgi:hypothetical protein
VVDFQHAYVFGLFIFGMDIHVVGHVLNVLFFVFRVLSFFLGFDKKLLGFVFLASLIHFKF